MKRSFLHKESKCTGEEIAIFYCCLGFVILLASSYAFMMCRKTMPFAEGWYTYYAQLMNEKGLLPYRDFEYLFSPVYIFTVSFLTRAFGGDYSVVLLRFVGVAFFALISIGVFFCVVEIVGKRKAWIGTLAATTAAFYLQSEGVQVFYDYVRLMDIFSVFTVLFLLKSVKKIGDSSRAILELTIGGTFNALFINTKQNMGMIFLAYAIVLIICVCIYYGSTWKELLRNLGAYLLPVATLTAILYLLLAISGSLKDYLLMTGAGAISAKGGLFAILFNWIPNNAPAFLLQIGTALTVLVIMATAFLLYRFGKGQNRKDRTWVYFGVAVFFAVAIIAGFLIADKHEHLASMVAARAQPSPYLIFEICVPAFVGLGIWGIICIVRKDRQMDDYILWFTLAGAYIAISWGCGNSGGLAEGQATLGVAFIVSFLLYHLDVERWWIFQLATLMCCICLVLQTGTKKMVNTYNWWGADESNYWDCEEQSEEIPLLRGIYMSAETKAVYEAIYKQIEMKTCAEDSIYCFPQIPIFYSICNRYDPGVHSKVQWFDVSTDNSVRNDIRVLEDNPPKAILMYDIGEYVYKEHERAFRNGEKSGTRSMREFLYEYIYENAFTFEGRYISGNNVLQLWIKEDFQTERQDIFGGGDGSFENPYKITTAQQLRLFAQQVNEGRSFEGQFVTQTNDIDLKWDDFLPIGTFGSGSYFRGTYDGAGHVIYNLSIKGGEGEKGNVGLFGVLGGNIYNLGIEGATISGSCVGTIASHSTGTEARIVNCYVKSAHIQGNRAGGIADNFNGDVLNCYFIGTAQGVISANAVSYTNSRNIENVFCDPNTLNTVYLYNDLVEDRVVLCAEEQMRDAEFTGRLNSYCSELIEHVKTDSGEKVRIMTWEQDEQGYPVLKSR